MGTTYPRRSTGRGQWSLSTFVVLAGALLVARPLHAATVLDPELAVRPVVSGLVTPTAIAFLGPGDFFVLEKSTGIVKRIAATTRVVLDLAVNAASERGLLGIALHPDFPSNAGVYLYWTCAAPAPAPENPYVPMLTECPDPPALGADTTDILAVPLRGNRVDRFEWNGATLTFARNIVKLRAFQHDGAPIPAGQGDEGQPPAGNHDGGVIRFGPDGALYVVIGDVGRRGAMQNLPFGPVPPGTATPAPDDQFGGPEPDDAHLTGVILRLDPDGGAPSDNPFFAVGAAVGGEAGANLQKVFAYGIRNSFGMAFDPLSGALWTSENGDDGFDELNRVQAGSNSGWIQTMGPVERVAQYKGIETSIGGGTLQQGRWPPALLPDTPGEALARLFALPGSNFSDPEFSWKFAVAPAAIGFLESAALGARYQGSLFVGLATPFLMGGPLFQFDLTGNRQQIAAVDPRLSDLVADNLTKHDVTESESLLFGTEFGVVTDIQQGPNGNLFVVSLSDGVVYEIASREVAAARRRFRARLTGAEEVPPVETRARGHARVTVDADATALDYKLNVANIRNVFAAHLHLGPAGTEGPIVAVLFDTPTSGRSAGVLARGTITSADLVGPLAGQPLSALIAEIGAANVYVNVHTTQNPDGEIRGQLR